jgi:hypothetical protein
MVRWGFVLEPASGGGTEVTQTWEVLPADADGLAAEENPGMTLGQRLDFMKAMAESGMPETLANPKRDAGVDAYGHEVSRDTRRYSENRLRRGAYPELSTPDGRR